MPDLKEKMEKIISEGGFLEAIEQFESEEQMLSFLTENGLTEEEAKEVVSSLEEHWDKTGESDDELGEEALEDISGGIIGHCIWPPIWFPGPIPNPFPFPKKWPWNRNNKIW